MAKGIQIDVDLSDFWEDSDYARETYVDVPVTDELVASVEAVLGLGRLGGQRNLRSAIGVGCYILTSTAQFGSQTGPDGVGE